jgi:carboxypeptidase family protein
MGPTGLWGRFPPEIPSGRASIEVLVSDCDGVPVKGADVWLGPPSCAGSSAVSFGDLRKAGVTNGAGIVLAKKLPEGSAAVAAPVGNLLNGPRGLDATSAVSTVLKADETVAVQVVLPVSLADFGVVTGTVTGPESEPLRSAGVTIGFQRVRTDREGRYELTFVPAGAAEISVGQSGYAAQSEVIDVAAGDTTVVDFELPYRETGDIDLRGTVVGPDGSPVAEARVYVIASSGRGSGTVRSRQTDEHGRFEFRALPDRLAKAEVRIQANREGFKPGNLVLANGLSGGEVEVVLPVRLTRLILTVVSSASGEPLTRCRFAARSEAAENPTASFSSRGPEGVYKTWLEPGPSTFEVEAPEGGGDFVFVARLVPIGERSVEVALTIILTDDATGVPIDRAKIEAFRPDSDTPLAGFEGERPGGTFVLVVPSGDVVVRVSAPSHAEQEHRMTLLPTERTARVELGLHQN